jgi:hypothetical protein
MITDIRKICFWTSIIVQAIFFGFYSYSIYDNIRNIPLLVIYIILFLVAITGFATFLIIHIRKIKNPKKFTRVLRVLKYFANGTMIVFSFYELIKFGMSDFSKILLTISITSLLIQVIIELIRIFIEKYIELYIASLKMDLSLLVNFNEMNSGGVWGWVNKPLGAIADKLEHTNQELNDVQKQVINIEQKHEEDLKSGKEQKKKLKKQKHEDAKQKVLRNLIRIKNSIFRKKKTEKEQETE